MAFPEGQKQKRNVGLIIAFVVLLILAIILLIILLTLTFKVPGCDTTECVTSAAEIMGTMDREADPCENFYDYACGGFQKQIPFTEKYVWGADANIRNQVNEKLFEEMENPDDENESIGKVKKFYRSCMDTDAINAKGSAPLVALIKYLGGWDLLPRSSLSRSWNLEQYLARAHDLDRPVFFAITGGSTEKEAFLVRPSPEIPLRHMKHFSVEAEEATIRFIKALAKLLNPSSTVHRLDENAHNIYILNYNVSQIDAKCQFGEKRTFANMEEFNQYMGDWFDLAKYWKEMTGESVLPTKSNVTVICPEFFKELGILLSPSSITKEQLANTLVWNTVNRFTATMGNEFRSAYKRSIRWMDMLLSGRSSTQPRWEYCLEKALDYFPGPLLAIYTSTTYDESDRLQVEAMVEQIMDAYKAELENGISWVDDEEKKLQLLKQMQPPYIARSTLALNYSTMDDEYDDYMVTEDNFDNHRKLRSKLHERSLESKSVRDARPFYTKERLGAQHLHDPADIEMTNNVLDIPSGILRRPFYSSEFASAVNYGALGMKIATKFLPISTGPSSGEGAAGDDGNTTTPKMFGRFSRDVSGREKGDANEDRRTYYEILTELLKQHNDLNLSGFNIHLSHAGKVFRDTGGLQLAYKAYRNWADTNSDTAFMVGLGLNKEQVFFLAFAQSHCIHITRELRDRIDEIGIDILDFHQVMNQALMNTAEFADAYGCSKRDGTMNPTFEKVDIWE